MKVQERSVGIAAALTFAVAGLVAASCGGGGGSTPTPSTPTTPSTPQGQVITVTIQPNGNVEPKEVRVALGESVRFVNNDSRTHEPQSNPHLVHTDCPALNKVGQVPPGQNRTTDPFTVEKVCGYHDHMNPDTAGLAGLIRVAGAEGPGGPIYVKH
jgi:plastocyanin